MTGLNAASLGTVPCHIKTPAYNRKNHGIGIVHLGLGAFHKAHQAFYTDAAMASDGGDWKIIGVSMRNEKIAANFNAQDGLFTLVDRGTSGATAQIIGSIAQAFCASSQPEKVLAALCEPSMRVVTITVTEKGYGIDRASGGVDLQNPVITHDLEQANAPVGALGLLVAALRSRRANGCAPFTVLCCDNLPDNGAFVRNGLIDFANQWDADLAGWIAEHVACPSSMVDRITPAQTPATCALAQELTGTEDILAIETESFHQWVIEDHFPTGRPAWEAAGAIFTDDVAPFEKMKLRLLNGSHSLIAYLGVLHGKTYVRDVMADPNLVALVRDHLKAAMATLPPMPDMDLAQYCDDLIERFRNPNIAHETFQIATDGSEKLPQRIFAPAVDALAADQLLHAFTLASAVWMWFCRSEVHEINDPRAELLRAAAKQDTPASMLAAFEAIPGLFPEPLVKSEQWRSEVLRALDDVAKINT